MPASYILIGLALFLPSWIIGTWQVGLVYGESSPLPNFFITSIFLCLLGVVVPALLGSNAFKPRYRQVTMYETTYSSNERGTRGKAYTKQYNKTEAISSILPIIMVSSVFGLVAIPLCLRLPILSLFLCIGALLLAKGIFKLTSKK